MLEIHNPLVIGGLTAIALFVLIILFLRVGRQLGLRAIERHGAGGMTGVGSLETAVFALLGLMIAFTFSGALTRFDTRRAQAVDEANAISTAYLRVDLLPASEQPRVREKFRQYVDARIATYKALPDVEAARGKFAKSLQLQGELWSMTVAASRSQDARPNTDFLVISAMNEMINFTTLRASATMIHPPVIIYVMLFGLALAAALLAGYQTAPERGYHWLQKMGFAFIVAFTVYIILDIEYPRLGFVRIDGIDQLLVEAREGMD